MRLDCGALAGDPAESGQVRLAYDHLVKDGFVVLDRMIAPPKVQALAEAFDAHCGQPGDGRRVASGRYVLPVELAGPFADPMAYAHPVVVAVVHLALDSNAILQGFGADVAMPGAAAPHIDRDGRPLFDASLSALLPAHALTCVLPLDGPADIAVWPGSHRWKARDENVPPEMIDLPPGSCLLRDVRLLSGGTANRGTTRLILLRATYARRWFRDSHHGLQRAGTGLAVGRDFLAGVAENRRRLFAHLGAA